MSLKCFIGDLKKLKIRVVVPDMGTQVVKKCMHNQVVIFINASYKKVNCGHYRLDTYH